MYIINFDEWKNLSEDMKFFLFRFHNNKHILDITILGINFMWFKEVK